MFRATAVSLVVLVLTAPVGAQGILTRTRLATDSRGSPPRPASPAPSPNQLVVESNWYDISHEDSKALFSALVLAGVVATSPLWGPAALFEEHFFSPGSFPGHPYALAHTGYIDSGMLYGSNDERDFFDSERVKPWATRMALEDGHDFGNLNRLSGRFALDTRWRVGISSDWDHYTERVAGGATDETTLGTLNLTLRIAQTDWLEMHAGAGARGMFDRYRTRGGVNFLYGADIFPIDPVVISSLVEVGNLNEALVLRLRASVGIQLRHAEIFAGYDWLRVGSVDLRGPMVGVRLWF